MNALLCTYLDLKFKERYLKKMSDMSRQEVKVSGSKPKLSYKIQYLLSHQIEAFERIIQSDNYDLQMLLVQMNDHKSVKWIVDRASIARDKKTKNLPFQEK